jgi:uncharacterized protein (AIM24 family)
MQVTALGQARVWTILAVVGMISAGSATGQDTVLDEGSFTILQDGTEVGTETFSIRSTGSGEEIRVTALSRVHVEGADSVRDVRSSLEVRGLANDLFDYQVQVVGDGRLEVRYTRDGSARMRLSLRSGEGVREREMRAPSGMIVLDEGMAHQFHFVGALVSRGETEAPSLVPATGAIQPMQLAELGVEAIEVGGASTRGRHVRVTRGARTIDLWFDSEWRLLRVSGPGSYAAIRVTLP